MLETCHRCGGDLPDLQAAGEAPSYFCPHCGAPQLTLVDYSDAATIADEAHDISAASSTGNEPPPRPNRIDWPMALYGALFVSAIAALFGAIATRLPTFSPIGSVWVISASLTTLALYQRRRPLAAMNAGIGARIGLLVGFVLAFFLAATLSAALCVGRYGLHALTGLDTEIALALKMQLNQLSATRPVPPDVVALVNSLQFRTAMMLCYFSLLLFAILLVSVFGGAIGGLLRTRRFGRKV
jgi:hypothetical protein